MCGSHLIGLLTRGKTQECTLKQVEKGKQNMTSPIRDIELQCPACGENFVTWHRDSVNMSLGEKWTKSQLEEATFAHCPACNQRFQKDVIIATLED